MRPKTTPCADQSRPAGSASSDEKVASWKRYINALLASELSALTRYYDRVIQWLPRDDDKGLLLSQIACKDKLKIEKGDDFPDLTREEEDRTAILINGTFNHHCDIQGLLTGLKPKLSRTSRLLLVLYNPYLRWAYKVANQLGLRSGELPRSHTEVFAPYTNVMDDINGAWDKAFQMFCKNRCQSGNTETLQDIERGTKDNMRSLSMRGKRICFTGTPSIE